MPGTLTTVLFVIAMTGLTVTLIGEYRLHRVEWQKLAGMAVRWSQPETRLIIVTLAAGIGAFAAMAGAFTSYGFELHALARSEPDAAEAARKLAIARTYAASGAALFCYMGWGMWKEVRKMVHIERLS